MNALAEGRLDGDAVVVDDTAQANRLHNKSLAGAPEAGNTLRLHRVEAAYCMERGWLDVAGTTFGDLLASGAADGGQDEVDHLCYRDLRERGLAVRLQDGGMQVWARGHTTKQEPWFHTRAFAERVPVTTAELADRVGRAVSVVDEDGTVTHYTVQAAVPQGDMHAMELSGMTGTVLDDRVLVLDAAAAAALDAAGLGTPHGETRILSLTEAEALRRRGVLDVSQDLHAHAAERHPDFAATLAAYEALAAAGVLARSGFRFGTHLRGYAASPDDAHAEWLVHCSDPEDAMAWSDLSRGIRLAHGVRKRFLLAVAERPVRFVDLAWFRP